MDNTQPKAMYLLLNHAISAAFKEQLLGCVVNDVTNPASGLLPDFAIPEDGNSPDYENLKTLMKGFLIKNLDADPQDQKKFKNQVNFCDLRTEKIVDGDVSVEVSLTKFLKTHYGSKEHRNFEIEAATGKHYHLHDATYQLKNQLWSNKYYRDCIYDVIDQKREDGTLETLNKCNRKYNIKKSHLHTCEVIILPMVVGILTCEEVKVNVMDGRERSHGVGVALPIGVATGLPLGDYLDAGASYEASQTESNRIVHTITDEVIVAIAYDLIAISTGDLDPDDPAHIHQPESRGLFSKYFSFGSSNTTHKPCPGCEANKRKPGPSSAYPAAWRLASMRNDNRPDINIMMGGADSNDTTSSYNSSMTPLDSQIAEPEDEIDAKHEVDLADAPIELYIGSYWHRYLFEQEFGPYLSRSSTASTTSSEASGIVGKDEDGVEGVKVSDSDYKSFGQADIWCLIIAVLLYYGVLALLGDS